MLRKLSAALLGVLLLATLSDRAAAQTPAAMIFGLDSAATPDSVTLPETTEQWFTMLSPATSRGTQVPSYWANKVGGELSAAIQTACGQSLSMVAYNQLSNCLAGSAVLPAVFQSTEGVVVGPGYSGSINYGFTAPSAGYAVGRGWVNLAGMFPAGGIESVVLSNSVNSTTSADTTTLPQYHEIVVPVVAGQFIMFGLTVTANSGTWTPVAETYRLAYEFFPKF